MNAMLQDLEDVILDDEAEWQESANQMRSAEGAWEDNGCRPLMGYEFVE